VPRFQDPEPLGATHVLGGFDCGTESLNRWLERHARQAQGAGSARIYVVHDEEQARVVGYHALAAASVTADQATSRAARGMPRHPIPAILLARLAVDSNVQGHGLGAWLLGDAMLRALNAADEVGIHVLLVHAIHESAASFYARHGFEPSPTDPLNLEMLIKDIRLAVEQT
jgi:GNAT superfamily N-acetyltransferase